MTIEQISGHIFPDPTAWLMDLNVRLADIQKLKGLKTEKWEEDGLGASEGLCIRLPSGRAISIVERAHAIDSLGARGPSIEASGSDVKAVGLNAMIAETLITLGLDHKSVAAIPGRRNGWIENRVARNKVRRLLHATPA